MTLEQQSAEAKSARLLDLYARFISGQTLNKQDLASEYGVTTRSIQRDMESLRCFLMEKDCRRRSSMTVDTAAIEW